MQIINGSILKRYKFYLHLIFLGFIALIFFGFQHVDATISPEQNLDNITTTLDQFGLKVEKITEEKAKNFSFLKPVGILVTESSALHLGKIKKNDIILEIDNINVENKSGLESYLGINKAKKSLDLTILRDQIPLHPKITKNEILSNKNLYENSTLFSNSKSNNFSLYRDLGLDVKYPSSWNVSNFFYSKDNSSNVLFSSLPETKYDSLYDYVMISTLDVKKKSIDSILKSDSNSIYLNKIFKSLNGKKLSPYYFKSYFNNDEKEVRSAKTQNISIYGSPGKNMTFKIQTIAGEIKIEKFAVIANTTTYVISFVTESENFNDYKPVINQMIKSIKFHKINTYSNIDYNFKIKYPEDIFNIDDSGYGMINFRDKKKNGDINQFKFPIFSIEQSPIFKTIQSKYNDSVIKLEKELDDKYFNYKTLHTNISDYSSGLPFITVEYLR